MRKQEATEKITKKQKKDKFNIREKVSSFRYNLTLRGRLFRERVKSIERWGQNKNSLLKDIPNGATTMMNFYDTPGNSTEVPPSPASVCSSVHDEYWSNIQLYVHSSVERSYYALDNLLTRDLKSTPWSRLID